MKTIWRRFSQFTAKKVDIMEGLSQSKKHKVEDILNNRQNKRLTFPGKITIIETLAASQLVYILYSLRTCFKSFKEINDLLFKLLWDGKRDKIKRCFLDIMAFNKSLKIAWIVKYISDDCKSKWKNLGDFFLSKWRGKLVFLGNLRKKRRYQTWYQGGFPPRTYRNLGGL